MSDQQFAVVLVSYSDWRSATARGPFDNEEQARKYAEDLGFLDAADDEREDDGDNEYVVCLLAEPEQNGGAE